MQFINGILTAEFPNINNAPEIIKYLPLQLLIKLPQISPLTGPSRNEYAMKFYYGEKVNTFAIRS